MKTLLLILLFPPAVNAELILSEILANEPGDSVQLEWIEVYNNSDTIISLELYDLIVINDTLALPQFDVGASSYAIFARQLAPDSGSPSFEGYWGNASGYWGDSPLELYIAADLDFALRNDTGFIALERRDNDYDDFFSWRFAPDNVSLERERVDPPSESWHECSDPSGSTPGRANSPPYQPADEVLIMKVEPRIIQPALGQSFSITISGPVGDKALIEILDDTGRRLITLLDSPLVDVAILHWRGLDADNNRLPPGIYLVFMTITGSIKATRSVPVVIAP